METAGDRIVRELEPLPHRERMEVLTKVLERMGLIRPERAEFLGKNARAWATAGALVLGVVAGAVLWTEHARGRLELTTEPAAASVIIDGFTVRDRSRSSISLSAGSHTLSVSSPGYASDDRKILIAGGRTLRVQVELEGSPDTGFEITSDPPGMQVWLDGQQLQGRSGPGLTNVRAGRIPPGRHVLELKADRGDWYWRQALTIEPGRLSRIHAVMVPFTGGSL